MSMRPANSSCSRLTYAVDGIDAHFTVIWNRVAAATPPQE
jgi:hypothetical protein